MAEKGKPTKYPGVRTVGPKKYAVRAVVTDPRTGKRKEVVRTYKNVTALEAARLRAELIDNIENVTSRPERRRVGEFAQSWIKSKALKVSENTARTYADALDQHVLPAFGDYYYDALTPELVQEWVDECLLAHWTTPKGAVKGYKPTTVHGWFRVLRTMTRDATEKLRLERDPTMRISFPEFDDASVSKAIDSETLVLFLRAMRGSAPQHFALTATLAYTGLRFCHVSALKWDDWNEETQAIAVSRRQVRGVVAPVSRKKRAPKQYPVEPELAEVLVWHRRRMLKEQAPGLAEGWMFPSSTGTLRTPSSLYKAWKRCIVEAGVDKRFTVHGLRYTFTDLVRRAKVDPRVRQEMLGHVTEEMQQRYSTIGIDEKREAVARVISLAPLGFMGSSGTFSGT